MITRRQLLATPVSAVALTAAQPGERQRVPLKIGHRASSMKMAGDIGVFRLARRIPGLTGVEPQMERGEHSLWDADTVRRYKWEAHRWGIDVPSISGALGPGVSIRNSPVAGIHMLKSIRAAEMLGARIILVPFFRDNAPDMNDESAYGPVVELLSEAARPARDAGVVLGLENSLSPADNKKLVDLIAEDSVKVYYDPHNMEHYGYTGLTVPGIKLLGKERICQVHVKNEDRLIEEPGRVDWREAFAAFNEIGYEGWYIFESRHTGAEQLIASTTKNIEFLKSQCRMGLG